ncbi:hypothetical protein [Streptomyces sp. NPDC050738]|uniref:hypothetical protein n=1 Tax=Streptomyces sp. NPDC050738 TaxID=3154744 RepID=UPI003422EA3A
MEFTALTGTASINTAIHRAGAAALRSNPAAATGFIEHQVGDAATNKQTFHRFYLYIATLPSATTPIYQVGQGGFFPTWLRLSPTGTLRLYDSDASIDVGTASPTLSTGQWFRVEIDNSDGATGTAPVVAYLDGVNFSGTAQITVTIGFSRIRAGIGVATTGDIYIDDIAVNDTSGAAQTGLPGPGSVVHLSPDSAGDNNGWATAVGGTAGAANNFTRVNEVTPNDVTSYNATALTGTTTIDDLNLASSASAGIQPTDRITLVAVGGRIGSNAVTAASIVYRIKTQTSGTVLESASVSVALNSWATHLAVAPFIHQLTSYVDPQAGGAWTPRLLDTAQIGYRGDVAQTTTRRVSTLWALVEFVPSAAARPSIARQAVMRAATR